MITALLCAAWLIGVGGTAWGAPGGGWTLIPLAALTGALGLPRSRPERLCTALTCAGLAALGVARWQAATAALPPDNISYLADAGPVLVSGVARADAEDRGRTRRIEVDVTEAAVAGEARAAAGGLLVRVSPGAPVRAGDRLQLFGSISPPPVLPGFDYRAYLARDGIDAMMEYPALRVIERDTFPFPRNLLAVARRAANRALDRALPFPESALARGIITGDRSAMPHGLTEEFNRSGTSHLIAISGFNITLVAVMVTAGLGWLIGRRRAALVALIFITAYAVFVGLTASVARALIMGMLAVGVSVLGRPGAPAIALALAAVVMTAHDPRIINDAGFQLSFSATAGLMLLAPPLTSAGAGVIARSLGTGRTATVAVAAWSVSAVTVAASLATLPVMLHTFGRASLIAPLPNLLLVPVFPLVMITAGAAALAETAGPTFGTIAGGIAWVPLAFTIAVVRTAARLPGAAPALPEPQGWMVAALYGCVAVAPAVARRLRGSTGSSNPALAAVEPLRLRTSLVVALVLPLVGGAVVWDSLRGMGDGGLTVTYTESSGTVLAVVTGPGGERVIIDTGPSPAALLAAVDPLLPGRDKRASLVVLTGNSPTNTGGLDAAITRYRPTAVLAPGSTAVPDGPPPGIRREAVKAGTLLNLSGGARLEFTRGSAAERVGVVAAFGSRRIALTPGAPGDVQVVPGARTATGSAVVQTEPGGYPWLDLRAQGPVRVRTDGRSLQLQPARGKVPPRRAITSGANAEP